MERFEVSGVIAKTELTTSLNNSTDIYPVPAESTSDHYVLYPGDQGNSADATVWSSSGNTEELACAFLPSPTLGDNQWTTIKNSLSNASFSRCDDLLMLISSCNRHVHDFRTLVQYFKKLQPNDKERMFAEVLPNVAALACELDSLFRKPIPKLVRQRQASITMSQRQAACLLANAFFCTLSHSLVTVGREGAERTRQKDHYYAINFASLFARARRAGRQSAKIAKLACVMHYFDRVTAADRLFNGAITYRRRVLTTFPDWSSSDAELGRLHVTWSGFIDVDGAGMLQVDFANRRIGGSVIGDGCVQEEIRFVVCPELMVARLLADPMDDNECIVVIGCECFSETSGYGDTFRWRADHQDDTTIDACDRRRTEVVAIDATPFRCRTDVQFSDDSVTRETNKAYCGFYVDSDARAAATSKTSAVYRRKAVATGNWGCGAFRGDNRLKALIQMMACAVLGRDLCYFTFHDEHLCSDIAAFYEWARERRMNVGQLWQATMRYGDLRRTKLCSKRRPSDDIFKFITDHTA